MKQFLKEPLVHFLVLGAALFLLYYWINPTDQSIDNNRIIIDNSDVDRLTKAYQQNWNSAPDSLTLKNLIAKEVKTEVFYREALKMQLDRNDEIIRRRLNQKYEFLVMDLAKTQPASEDELKRFYSTNPRRYQVDKKISFTQFYFNPDKRTEPIKDAQIAFEKISTVAIEELKTRRIGDPFHLPSTMADSDYHHVRQIFGQDFTKSLFETETEGWLQPISSGYGTHLVYVANLRKGQLANFNDIKDRVLDDWRIEQQQIYNEDIYKNLLKTYEVIYDLN